MLPKKHLSGSAKRKKRKLDEQFIDSQKGAMHKFVIKQPSDNQGIMDQINEPEINNLGPVDQNLDAENNIIEEINNTVDHDNEPKGHDIEDLDINQPSIPLLDIYV